VGDSDSPALSKLPDRFGNYSILGHLATGGMAEVYLARQTGLEGFEKTVVIKRVRPELLSDRDVTASFLDEARLVATLQHPNIAQVYEIGLVNNTYFLVMEYVDGADLRQLMERASQLGQRVTIEDAIYILIQACVALHYAHEKRGSDGQRLDIIHRDVTPSNVLLSHDGAVKVCDFGIAKATNRTTETARGALKGKYPYMSPEQCRCTELDRRSDIFALGVLLYELSTLTHPFSADSDFELLRAIIETPVVPPSSRVRHYPHDLERIVLRAVAKDPDARYPTAQAMQLDLEALAREHRSALSSVNLAKLMAELFNDRVDARLRAQRDAQATDDPLVDTAANTADPLPATTLRRRPPRATPPRDELASDTQPELAAISSPLDPRPTLQPSLSASTTNPVVRAARITSTPNAPNQLPLGTSPPDTPFQPPLGPSPPDAPFQLPRRPSPRDGALQPPLTASPPNAPTPLPLTASTPNALTQVALTASTPNALTQVALTASTPNALTQSPPTASTPNALTQSPLTASTPNAPTRLPQTASKPNARTHVALTASTPNAPPRLPLTASTPNAPTRLPLTASTPDASTQVPLIASMPYAPPGMPSQRPAGAEPSAFDATPFPLGTRREAAPRRPTKLWLLGAFAAALFATGVSIAGLLIDRAADAAGASDLDADAERLASALDAGIRSARLRATGIAATPVLRAAIETDAATMKDLAVREYAFSVAAGETLEIFQSRNGKTRSLLRLPETDPRIEPLTDTTARVQATGNQLTLIVGAPISTTAGVRGSLALATRIDLTPATPQLAQHAVEASLHGRGLDFRLVDPRAAPRGNPRTIPLPTTSDLASAELALIATPVATISSWVPPARFAAIAAAALLLVCYLISLWRSRTAARPG
jgi:serine/threonine protein kinase